MPALQIPRYLQSSGTSFAAPVVAGTVALMLEANRSLTPLQVKAVLIKTAQRVSGFTNKSQSLVSQGAGLLNAVGAVHMALAINPSADRLVPATGFSAAVSR